MLISTFGALVKIPEMNSANTLSKKRNVPWDTVATLSRPSLATSWDDRAQGDEVTSSSSLHQKSMAWQWLEHVFTN